MKKNLIVILLACGFLNLLNALDLSAALHVDTYADPPSVGFSFLAQENITKNIGLLAQADYLSANSYDAQTLIVAEISKFTFGGGLALEIRSGAIPPMVPGVGLLFGVQATKQLKLEGGATLTFTSENLAKLYNVKGDIKFLYNTDNANALISYALRKGIATDDFVNTFKLEVEAFGPGIPVGLIIGSKIDLLLVSPSIGIDVDVVGGLLFITGKYGTYFAKAKIGVLNHREGIGIPYDIAVGAKLTL